MIYVLIYVILLLCGPQRVRLVVLLPLIFLDCLGSAIVGESFGSTLSAKAHDAALNKHPYWQYAERVINTLFWFQPQHCARAWTRELNHGSVWKAWLADWRRSPAL